MTTIQTVTTVSDVDSSDWKYVLEVNQPLEDFESDIEVKLAGEALAFFEAIKTNGAITLTKADDVENYIETEWNFLWEEDLIPANGIVDADLERKILDRTEELWQVILEDEALVQCKKIIQELGGNVASVYEPEEQIRSTEDEDRFNELLEANNGNSAIALWLFESETPTSSTQD